MKEPVPQFSDVISKAKELGLAYIHLIEPRVSDNVDREHPVDENLDFAIDLWDKPILLAGATGRKTCRRRLMRPMLRKTSWLCSAGISSRTQTSYSESRTVCRLISTTGAHSTSLKDPVGYLDYPFSDEFLAEAQA